MNPATTISHARQQGTASEKRKIIVRAIERSLSL